MAEQSIWQASLNGDLAPTPLRWASAAAPTTPFHPARSAIEWSQPWDPAPPSRPLSAQPWPTRAQASRALPSRSLYARPLPFDGIPRAPRFMDTSAAEALPLDPTDPRYWTRHGGGHPILKGIAFAHIALGLLGIVLGMLAWYLLEPGALLPIIISGSALLATVAGAVVLELSRATSPQTTVAARVLLVSTDLLLTACLLWLLGGDSLAPSLFLIPIVVAALFFSTRHALLVAALAVASFFLICAGQSAFTLAQWLPSNAGPAIWLPRGIALAVVAVVLIYCCGLSVRQTSSGFASLFERITLLTSQRAALRGEQQRLIEAMRLLEDTHASLTQERTAINGQILALTTVVERLANGDFKASRALDSQLYGPLNAFASALDQLTQRFSALNNQHQQLGDQRRDLSAVAALTREQTHLLTLTDTALRDLSASANDLVAEVQGITRDALAQSGAHSRSDEPPSVDPRALDQSLRAVEQHALNQASNTAMLGARLAQLRAHQTELAIATHHLTHAASLDDPPADQQPDQEPKQRPDEAERAEAPRAAALSPQAPYGRSNPGDPNHGSSNPGVTPSFPRLVVGQRLEPLPVVANPRPDGPI